MRKLLFALLCAAGLLVACTSASTAATATLGATDNFWIHCLPSRTPATIDPIVDPGSITTGHYHDFFGNTGLDENSTPGSLVAAGAGATSCTTNTDTAAYWAPTLLLNPGETQTYSPAGYPCGSQPDGTQVCHYTNVRAYYGLQGESRAGLTITPAGEEAIGGDHLATGPQTTGRIAWACGGSSPFEQYPYDCTKWINTSGNTDQDGITLRVIFPRCWDGTGTAPADFAYPAGDVLGPKCVAPFTKVLPLVNVRFHTGIVTPCPGAVCPPGSQVSPAFGFLMADGTQMPWYDAHGDFMNGWQTGDGGIADLELDCLKAAQHCPVNPHTSPTSNMPT
jgi:Domain of unknown function (DUF1996)